MWQTVVVAEKAGRAIRVHRLATELVKARQRGLLDLDIDDGNRKRRELPGLEGLALKHCAQKSVVAHGRVAQIRQLLKSAIASYAEQGNEVSADIIARLFGLRPELEHIATGTELYELAAVALGWDKDPKRTHPRRRIIFLAFAEFLINFVEAESSAESKSDAALTELLAEVLLEPRESDTTAPSLRNEAQPVVCSGSPEITEAPPIESPLEPELASVLQGGEEKRSSPAITLWLRRCVNKVIEYIKWATEDDASDLQQVETAERYNPTWRFVSTQFRSIVTAERRFLWISFVMAVSVISICVPLAFVVMPLARHTMPLAEAVSRPIGFILTVLISFLLATVVVLVQRPSAKVCVTVWLVISLICLAPALLLGWNYYARTSVAASIEQEIRTWDNIYSEHDFGEKDGSCPPLTPGEVPAFRLTDARCDITGGRLSLGRNSERLSKYAYYPMDLRVIPRLEGSAAFIEARLRPNPPTSLSACGIVIGKQFKNGSTSEPPVTLLFHVYAAVHNNELTYDSELLTDEYDDVDPSEKYARRVHVRSNPFMSLLDDLPFVQRSSLLEGDTDVWTKLSIYWKDNSLAFFVNDRVVGRLDMTEREFLSWVGVFVKAGTENSGGSANCTFDYLRVYTPGG